MRRVRSVLYYVPVWFETYVSTTFCYVWKVINVDIVVTDITIKAKPVCQTCIETSCAPAWVALGSWNEWPLRALRWSARGPVWLTQENRFNMSFSWALQSCQNFSLSSRLNFRKFGFASESELGSPAIRFD